MPEETLEQHMMGCCRAGATPEFSSRTYCSDATLLDSALSDATLTDISTLLPEGISQGGLKVTT